MRQPPKKTSPKKMKIKEIFIKHDSRYTVKEMLRWLWHLWRGNRLQAALNAVLGLLSVAVSLMSVWAVKNAIDVASRQRDGSLLAAVAIMGGLILCDFAISISAIWVRNILGIRAQNRMQQRMLERVLRTEAQGRGQIHSGDVLNRLEGDVAGAVNFLTETIPGTLSVVTLFLGAFFYLYSMEWRLALLIVVMLPVFILFSKAYMLRMRRLTRLVRDADSRVQSLMQETVQHATLIKTMERISTMVTRVDDVQGQLRRHVIRRTAFSVLSNLTLNFGFSLGYLIAFAWSAYGMQRGALTFGAMTAFLQLVSKIQGPARSLTKLVPAFVSVLTAVERLMELEEKPEEPEGERQDLSDEDGVGLRFGDVTFSYEKGSERVLEHFSHDFRPHSVTAIVGSTGRGKTTLIRLILALGHPESGTVEIYNKEKALPVTPLVRCNYVYVPQGNTLLSGTIRENLLLGDPAATEEAMQEALHMACCDFVFALPQGMETPCNERGGGLSEGQAQRIAIARALLRRGGILLLDESTSALDEETERRLLKNVLSRRRTTIFITHRTKMLSLADEVLRL